MADAAKKTTRRRRVPKKPAKAEVAPAPVEEPTEPTPPVPPPLVDDPPPPPPPPPVAPTKMKVRVLRNSSGMIGKMGFSVEAGQEYDFGLPLAKWLVDTGRAEKVE